MARSIRIDPEVYDYLRQQAEPLTDTPNRVLRRLLGLESETPDGMPTAPSPARTTAWARPPGSPTPAKASVIAALRAHP